MALFNHLLGTYKIKFVGLIKDPQSHTGFDSVIPKTWRNNRGNVDQSPAEESCIATIKLLLNFHLQVTQNTSVPASHLMGHPLGFLLMALHFTKGYGLMMDGRYNHQPMILWTEYKWDDLGVLCCNYAYLHRLVT